MRKNFIKLFTCTYFIFSYLDLDKHGIVSLENDKFLSGMTKFYKSLESIARDLVTLPYAHFVLPMISPLMFNSKTEVNNITMSLDVR